MIDLRKCHKPRNAIEGQVGSGASLQPERERQRSCGPASLRPKCLDVRLRRRAKPRTDDFDRVGARKAKSTEKFLVRNVKGGGRLDRTERPSASDGIVRALDCIGLPLAQQRDRITLFIGID